jgi:transcriptional regulator with XRE-family HTH domain
MRTINENPRVGASLRQWRERRRLSQLDLAGRAGVSPRHLSFVETGRSLPSDEMILRLAEQLDVPLRDRNRLLLAGGYAPAYPEHALDAPPMSEVTTALRQVLAGHEPYPALVVNRRWELVDYNDAVLPLMADAAAHLLEPPVNVLRLSLHPDGIAPRIVNLSEWRAHLLGRLLRQADATGDLVLADLYRELGSYPGAGCADRLGEDRRAGVVVPLRIRLGAAVLSFFSTTTVFGTPLDVTVAELAIEAFYPADAATAQQYRPGNTEVP